ncbi:hypothetical protein [Mycobacterium sp. Marseille-P9652]|uniref:hypothetical protein n=1 Tax=Mycobacterium sp. Marseille-P9652 TaxID=2654950 RepID=UPI0012E9418A|nr:hypothetical protein [Mycobacterium sp. Marseille-P9652]
MNGAMMGLAGMVVGASAVGVAGVARSITDTVLPRMMGSTDHKHQVSMSLQAQRYETIQRWRAGLANARDAYQQWAQGSRQGDPPNVVGDEWFEGLRPHLPTTGEAAEYRTACELHCENTTLVLLSLEIGRIEREWNEEAMGGGRRRGRRN